MDLANIYDFNIALLKEIDPAMIPSTLPLVPELVVASCGATAVLDLGCGSGAKTAGLAALARCSVLGVDVNERAIQIAKQHYSLTDVQFVTMDARNLSGLRSKFDVVNMSALLTCVVPRSAREEIIAQTVAALNPHGVIIIADFLRSWHIPAYRHRYKQGEEVAGEEGSFPVVESGQPIYYAHHFSDREPIQTMTRCQLRILTYRNTCFLSRSGNYVLGFVM